MNHCQKNINCKIPEDLEASMKHTSLRYLPVLLDYHWLPVTIFLTAYPIDSFDGGGLTLKLIIPDSSTLEDWVGKKKGREGGGAICQSKPTFAVGLGDRGLFAPPSPLGLSSTNGIILLHLILIRFKKKNQVQKNFYFPVNLLSFKF